jgi:Cd2+/Zn2+-exporting ATPase
VTKLRLDAVLTVLCGLGLALSFVSGLGLAASIGAIFGSIPAIRSAYTSLVARELDVNVLMILAAIGAVIVGRAEDAAALLFLFALSSTLEEFALGRTKSAIEGLIRLRPETAVRLHAGGEETVKVSDLQIGDLVRVDAFQQIPADGELVVGAPSIDESAMTGESVPVEKSLGDRLLAGTQNLDQSLQLRVTVAAGDTTLEKIVTLVQEAQESKGSGERISIWFGQRYTIFVLLAFVVALGIRLTLKDSFSDALRSSITLLVALSPCALVISTPAATLSALARAGRRGMLVRGGESLEKAGHINTVAFDKTGTLTVGKPELVEVRAFRGDERAMLAAVAAAEVGTTHPAGVAIVEAGKTKVGTLPETFDHATHAGMGVTATVEGLPVRAGQPKFFESLPEDVRAGLDELRSAGLTGVVGQVGEGWIVLGLRDVARPEARGVLASLKSVGVTRFAMLTGDGSANANAVAREIGLEDVHAELLPAEKVATIRELRQGGRRVLMVGDGVNDAPALMEADLGVAMGGLGSDIAMNAADVILVQDKLSRVPELIELGGRTNRTIRANLLFAAGVILLLTVLSFAWSSIPALVRFGPTMPLPLAVLGHEGSTVLVILNGLRLLRG